MKTKFFFLVLFFSAIMVASAQTGLQFNQVVLASPTLGGSFGNTASVGTVPAGKVWKIENVWSDADLSGGAVYWKVNGGPAATIPYQTGSSAANTFMSNQNIWLPAGTVVSLIRQGTTGASQVIYFSIIEFTVIP